MSSSRDKINRILTDSSASYWLKQAIKDMLKRDALDAVCDAECLAELLKERLHEIQGK